MLRILTGNQYCLRFSKKEIPHIEDDYSTHNIDFERKNELMIIASVQHV
jgi:hypothetical protein